MRFWSTLRDTVLDTGLAASVTILTVKGSAPREPGARMVIRADGGFHGTIGGGTLEWRAIAEAQRLLASNGPAARISKHALGPELGQCCGGSVQLLIERFSNNRLEEISNLAGRETDGPILTCGRLTDSGVTREFVRKIETPHTADISETGEIMERFDDPRRPVYLFGAGHVGRALVLALAPLPFDILWIDGRDGAFPSVTPPNVTLIASSNPPAELQTAPDSAFILVLTHSHAMDQDIVQAALEADRFPYVGLIGSATKRARFTHRLEATGMDRARIDAELVCPIGVPEITSKHPAAIAAGVASDLLVRDSILRATDTQSNEQHRKHSAGGTA